jgi:signal transduction histidine kinase
MCLSDFIRDNMEELLQEWETFACTLLPSGKTLDRAGLRDDAESLLRAIALDMEGSQSMEQQSLKSKGARLREPALAPRPANTHAHDRYAIGLDLDQLVAEYRAVRASVTRLWTQTMGQADQSALQELTRFNEAIDEALADSVARYTAIVERTKNLFLAVLGHDLRGPLTTVLAAANTLLRSEDESSGTAKTAALIARSGKRMGWMVSDLIEFTRTRLGDGIPLVRVPMDLAVVIREAIEEIEAAHPGQVVRLTTSGELGGRWDPARLGQAIANLIQNGIQHGSVKTPVTVSLNGEADQVIVAVHNHGPPISEHDRQRIFEPLVSVAETSSSPGAPPHMGLGLHIAREIVHSHGGAIAVESSESAGTTFKLSLPRH